jgi:hypothetical protein
MFLIGAVAWISSSFPDGIRHTGQGQSPLYPRMSAITHLLSYRVQNYISRGCGNLLLFIVRGQYEHKGKEES